MTTLYLGRIAVWLRRVGEIARSLRAWFLALTWRTRLVWLSGAFGLFVCVAIAVKLPGSRSGRTLVTVGELQTVHAEVRLGAQEVRGTRRLSPGDRLTTGADGRARLRLDDGTIVVVDRSTEVMVAPGGIGLGAGRIFVVSAPTARSEITAGSLTTVVTASAVAFDRHSGEVSAYCADGEAVVRAKDQQSKVRSGETARVGPDGLKVAPEKAFNDWTGGMAAPWSATGPLGSAVGELVGSAGGDEGGSPVAIRSLEIQARIEGEVATTHVETTYFNATSQPLVGDFRMAIPPGAIVSRFALRRGENVLEGTVESGSPTASLSSASPQLGWAGPGWVRGYVPGLGGGEAVGIIVDWVEWLTPAEGRITYRYPMVSEGPPPLVGELRARIDASSVHPRSLAVGRGATVERNVVEIRKADVRPAADLVVELEAPSLPRASARSYTVPAAKGEGTTDPYFMVRTEVPTEAASSGVTLALVLDTSWSISPALLEVERAVVESILEGLGEHDRVAVLAADQEARGLGPAALGPVDAARRQAIRESLVALRSGGASDLGVALERAADALPVDAPDGIVVYIGDGWPTLGGLDADALRARLSRRAGGVPRLGAVAIGPQANRFGLAAVVKDSGPVLAALDRADAANVAVALLVGALESVTSGVEIDLGPAVDRVYPRGAQTVAARGSVSVVGRLRGPAPEWATLRYHRGARVVEEKRRLESTSPVSAGDVRRRWALARIADLVGRGESIETASDVAVRARLLTPWTSWFGPGGSHSALPLVARLLDPVAASLMVPPSELRLPPRFTGSLLEPAPNAAVTEEQDFRALMDRSIHRTLESAEPGMRRCRDARRSLRPEIGGTLVVKVTVDGQGRASDVDVRAKEAVDDDPALDRCVEKLVESLPFFDSQTTTRVTVTHEVKLPPRETAARKCSQTAALPLSLRRSVWRERLSVSSKPDVVYQRAARACELPAWIDQRALLELVLDQVVAGPARVATAAALETVGESAAAEYLRRAAVDRASDPRELDAVRAALVGDEPKPGLPFYRQYRAATSDEARLGVVRRFLRASPHDAVLRRRLLALLEALGKKDVLIEQIAAARRDPFADAELLGDGASALLRNAGLPEARRAFAELLERAPGDPYARAYAGDRLRDERLFDDATLAYEALGPLLPGDPAASLRLALAHAGAGRLDVAVRVLDRISQTGGRADDARLGELAALTAAVVLGDARSRSSGDEARRLEERALEIALPDAAGVVLVRAPALTNPIEPRILRPSDPKTEVLPDLSAPSVGIFATRIEPSDGELRIRIRRPPELQPTRPVSVRIDVLSVDSNTGQRKLTHKELELGADGKDVEVRWDGAAIQ
jgi:tetratricopeptide (TPR) repeat protein